MSAFFALMQRDLILAARSGGSLLTLLTFFLCLSTILPIAIGPDKQLLAQLGPALIWLGVLLSSLLAIERIFMTDAEEGALFAFQQGRLSLSSIALAKLLVHWLTTALPLILMTPLVAALFFLDGSSLVATLIALLIGTPALASLSLIAASLSVSLKRGNAVAPILVLPLAIPIIIFGVTSVPQTSAFQSSQSALMFLTAISLVFVTFSPFCAALALKLSSE